MTRISVASKARAKNVRVIELTNLSENVIRKYMKMHRTILLFVLSIVALQGSVFTSQMSFASDDFSQSTLENFQTDSDEVDFRWLTNASKDAMIKLSHEKVIVIQTTSASCGWCRKMYPEMIKFQKEHPESVAIYKVDLDESEFLIGVLRLTTSTPGISVYYAGKRVGVNERGYLKALEIKSIVEDMIQKTLW